MCAVAQEGSDHRMALSSKRLRVELQHAGIANAAIDAVWPSWWSEDANESVSATTELTYTVARRLGLSPSALFDGSTKFLWRDDTKFKNLGTTTERQQEILASFAVSIGCCALAATPAADLRRMPDASTVRETILEQEHLVDATELLTLCWSLGIPVLQLRIFPLHQKRMHAVTVHQDNRYAILIGYETKYTAVFAYILAHEIAHILLGHLQNESSLLDIENPLEMTGLDEEETEADRTALLLLTGSSNPQIFADRDFYNATALANAAMSSAASEQIDPGVLALCLGHSTQKWEQSYGALKIIPPGEEPVGDQINALATSQLDWQSLSYTNQEYLSKAISRNP
jgi:hypothetical protein